MSKDEQIKEAAEHVHKEYAVQCGDCPRVRRQTSPNATVFANFLIVEGWLVTGGKMVCPRCGSKRRRDGGEK